MKIKLSGDKIVLVAESDSDSLVLTRVYASTITEALAPVKVKRQYHRKHKSKGTVTCPICGREFPAKGLNAHVRFSHPDKTFAEVKEMIRTREYLPRIN